VIFLNNLNFPLEDWTNWFVDHWLVPTLGGFFTMISHAISIVLDGFQAFLIWVRPEIMAFVILLIVWRTAGKKMVAFTLVGLLYIASVHLWAAAMQTLSIVLAATIFSIGVGVPIGILCAKSDRMDRWMRPILDFMQTLPSFVYLIPTILLFGIGGVPAVISTFIFAAPPAVRLTNLGIRQVPEDIVEAARAFGSTPWQMLTKVQMPMALPTVMAGINQTIMLALSMAVIASMIGAPGLGSTVLSGISQVNVGLGLIGGLGIVVLAIVLDRITEGLGGKKADSMK
jgi:glycine betaine/proline transport system permease protein